MLKRYLPPDLVPSLRVNALGIAVFVAAVLAFLWVSVAGLNKGESIFQGLLDSQWVVAPEAVEQRYEAGARYDLSQKGIKIPPARQDRAGEGQSEEAVKRAQYYSRDCYSPGYTIEESDLCAQWANAAAMRFGNTIAVETYRLNYLVGFITALGVFLAGIGVVLAGAASISASRGVAMMALGFMPALSFTVRHLNPGWVKVTVRNVGTGPASDIRVKIDGQRVRLEQDRLAAGTHMTFDRQVVGEELVIEGHCIDLAQAKQPVRSHFVREGDSWRLADEQSDQDQE